MNDDRRDRSFDPKTPIFQELPDDDGEDWSGFVIGGMAVTNEFSLARSYKMAADDLVDAARAASDLSYEYAYPILYLYRHAIELLKLVLPPKKKPTHELAPLVAEFKALVREKLNQRVPAWAIARLKEFAEVDPDAQAFRFARDQKGEVPLVRSGEWWVKFDHLRKTMDRLTRGFESAYFAIGKR